MKFQQALDICTSFLFEQKNGVIIVVGPTASGKTSLSIELAKQLGNGEIINADSRQIYSGLPILTAVPTKQEQQEVPHHLFECIAPETAINVSHWKDLAEKTIYDIQKRNNIPIICGGTGLWINTLTKNFSLGVEPNEEFRASIRNKTNDELWDLLQKKDPQACIALHKNNKKYVIRALEICEEKGSKTLYATTSTPLFPFLFIGITHPRKDLYMRIEKRNELMFEQGVLDEAKHFLNTYTNIPSMDSAFISHGLPELQQYFNNLISLEKAKEIMIMHTKRYAKRQLTWWRKDHRLQWFCGKTGESITISDPQW